jgi:hypothetical protein
MAASKFKDVLSEVQDNGNRGKPRPGCDCMQCFGYCLIDADKYARDKAASFAQPVWQQVLEDK